MYGGVFLKIASQFSKKTPKHHFLWLPVSRATFFIEVWIAAYN